MKNCRLLAPALVALLISFAAADEQIGVAIFRSRVTIDATKTGPPINPFIYGQFIEHLGRCIYGGIWAEMVEDRKFFFPISDKYDPYRGLKDTNFPVVGASPWEVLGPPGSVTMETEKPFVGDHSPRIAAGAGIRQNDLGLVAGRKYVGHVWLRAPEHTALVKISLAWGDNQNTQKASAFPLSEHEFIRHDFEFIADKTTDHGALTISASDAPILVGTVSLMPADNIRGMRADTIALLKQLNAPVYRWPGGNFVSGYDWRDGIGERDRRPPRRNPAWTGVEHNDVGIDEFIAFCHEVDAEPMIAANTGFGDDYSAAQEVEYCNAAADTIGGSWRAKNGHSEPFGVKYWCVGNEMYGNWQLGHLPLAQYTQKHNRFAAAMRKVDAGLVLVGSSDLDTQATLGDGDQRRQVNWSQGMLERCADNMNLISEHFYRGRMPWSKEPAAPTLRHVGQLRESIRAKAQGHRELQQKLGRQPADFIPIDMDEWNYWHQPYEYGELGCKYDLADGLGVAAGLHEYFRNSDIIHAAMYAQTVNVIGCIKTTKTAAFFDTTALPLLLYRREFGTIPLTVTGDQEAHALDIAAARTADGRAITIGIVNPNAEPQTISMKIAGVKVAPNATLWRIAGNDPQAFNTSENQPIKIEQIENATFGDELTLPPYSINLYRVPVDARGN